VPLSALLFAVQHYRQPHNWPLIFVPWLLITSLVVRSRSLRLGIVMHTLANCTGILLTLAAVVA
jgi:membrane protease YdiL (CAAX protease family)